MKQLDKGLFILLYSFCIFSFAQNSTKNAFVLSDTIYFTGKFNLHSVVYFEKVIIAPYANNTKIKVHVTKCINDSIQTLNKSFNLDKSHFSKVRIIDSLFSQKIIPSNVGGLYRDRGRYVICKKNAYFYTLESDMLFDLGQELLRPTSKDKTRTYKRRFISIKKRKRNLKCRTSPFIWECEH